MSAIRVFLGSALLLQGFISMAVAQAPAPLTTLHVDTRLVFLDTTVIDKQGHIVTRGLTKDDFFITEEKQPRRVFSFEPPEQHMKHSDTAGSEPPVTILVVDELNGSFQDYAFIRHSLQRYFDRQPSELESPCELMLLGYHSLQMVQGFTRNKAELISALNHIAPPPSFVVTTVSERFNDSVYALQMIALQNQGVPGRKNVLWVGYGAPIAGHSPDQGFQKIVHFTHTTTNMLLDARVSLFLIYPGIGPYRGTGGMRIGQSSASEAKQTAMTFAMDNGSDPFAGNIRFGAFASATGGDLFYRNDLDNQVERARALGSGYYTLTYQPQQIPVDGKFRNIRVIMRNPELRAITKTGYFAPDPEDSTHPARQLMENLTVAVHSAVPLHGLNIRTEDLSWRPDTGTAQFTVLLEEQSLRWQVQADGQSTTNLFFAVVSLKRPDHILTSTYQEVGLTRSVGETASPADTIKQPIVFHVPPKTTNLRFVIETEDGDKLGNGEISRDVLDAAPQTATPAPVLISRPLR
jgi:VWFA-related protein